MVRAEAVARARVRPSVGEAEVAAPVPGAAEAEAGEVAAVPEPGAAPGRAAEVAAARVSAEAEAAGVAEAEAAGAPAG